MLHAVGTVGLVLLLGAYFLVSTRRLSSVAPTYQAMNLVGGIILVGYSFALEAWASVALNVVWSGIAAAALIRSRRADAPE